MIIMSRIITGTIWEEIAEMVKQKQMMDGYNFFPETSLQTSCCRMLSLQAVQWGENSCLDSFFN